MKRQPSRLEDGQLVDRRILPFARKPEGLHIATSNRGPRVMDVFVACWEPPVLPALLVDEVDASMVCRKRAQVDAFVLEPLSLG